MAEECCFRILCLQKHYKYNAFSSEWLRILTNISVSAFWGSQKPSADIGANELLRQNTFENHICKQLATSTDRQVDAKRYFVNDFHYVFQRFRILHAQNAHHSNISKSKRAGPAPQQLWKIVIAKNIINQLYFCHAKSSKHSNVLNTYTRDTFLQHRKIRKTMIILS